MHLKTRHRTPYVTRPSAEQLDGAYAEFQAHPSEENRDALLLITQRYSLSRQYNDNLASRVMENVWRSIRPTTASELLAPYDPSKGAAFSTWLYQVVARKSVDDHRRSKPKEKTFEDERIERIHCAREDPYRSKGRSWSSPKPTSDQSSAEPIPAKLYRQLEGSVKE
jgi:DNA-directed RNA polymerase specialized sigma24 family protein